jgi:hypothetical protein
MLEAPSPTAARQRRFRERQRNGEVVVSIALTPAEVDLLHRLGCVDLARLEDRAALVEALHLLLSNISLR